ncbi:hypothetical protein GCM10011425_34350 [Mucilaginibacter galii]|uniref:Uncharacterized protein n=1 Tax=Mucilaginibacter galii TaxID=2005073 RepID=A0A917JAS7_9SPHI|nr:hypothetical protein GCM10011425_34350 [Mucilaginibacter galii]
MVVKLNASPTSVVTFPLIVPRCAKEPVTENKQRIKYMYFVMTNFFVKITKIIKLGLPNFIIYHIYFYKFEYANHEYEYLF